MNRSNVARLLWFLACCTLLPETAGAQDARPSSRRSVFGPLFGGAVAGLGLAVGLINQDGDAWLIDDEAALPLSLVAGLAGAFVVRAQSAGLAPMEPRRPRMRLTAGLGNGMDWDVALGYRAPVRERLEVEGLLLVINESWELIETETRCSPIGCITGDFVTDHAYEQSVAALARGAVHLRPRERVTPSFSIAGGPILLHVDEFEEPRSRSAGLLLDGAIGLEAGLRSRWIIEAGYRLIAGGRSAAVYGGGWSVRAGWALGY